MLDAAPNATVREPGGFRRKGTDGPPYIPSLTKTRQPKGNKADLIAKCEARGIDVPAKVTVAQLTELLGPEPADELYGRPSGFGDPLESSYALRKWIERGIAAGVVRLVVDGLDPASVDLDNDDALDRLVMDAQDAVDAMVWADRGTHVHLIVERIEAGRDWSDLIAAGEALGIPEPLQHAIADAWIAFRADLATTSIRCELPVVNDELRIAGTLDLLDLCGKALDTEFGRIEAGSAVIGDVKTGDLRDKYCVQIAGYQGATPFDTDTEQRGAWPTQPVADIGLIYHMSMKAALNGEPVRWEAIPVDLAAGRDGARICVEARDWPARPVFGAPIAAPLDGDGSAQPVEPEVSPSAPPAPAISRDELKARVARIEANAKDTGWHAEFVARWTSFGITKDSTDAEILAALDAIEAPFNPESQPDVEVRPMVEGSPVAQIDRGDPVSAADVEALVASIKSSSARASVNVWLVQSRDAGCSWDVRTSPYERNYQITRAALRLAETAERTDDPDEFARMVVALVMADVSVIQPAFVIGETLAALTIVEARRLADVCTALAMTDRAISPADVAAALAAA